MICKMLRLFVGRIFKFLYPCLFQVKILWQSSIKHVAAWHSRHCPHWCIKSIYNVFAIDIDWTLKVVPFGLWSVQVMPFFRISFWLLRRSDTNLSCSGLRFFLWLRHIWGWSIYLMATRPWNCRAHFSLSYILILPHITRPNILTPPTHLHLVSWLLHFVKFPPNPNYSSKSQMLHAKLKQISNW